MPSVRRVHSLLVPVRASLAPAADRTQMEELFQNLIGNAIHDHHPGVAPRINIRCDRVKDEWQFSVEDNGEGIPREHQDLTFQAMKRLHGNETRVRVSRASGVL